VDELRRQLRKWGMRVTDRELLHIFNHFDRKGDGKWSFEDFCTAFTMAD